MSKKNEYIVGGMAGIAASLTTIGIIMAITGAGGILSVWYTDSLLEDNIERIQFFQTEISEKKYELLLSEMENTKTGLSGIFALAQILFYSGVALAVVFIIIGKSERTEFDKDKRTKILFYLTPNALTISFSILFAIGLIFISSASFLITTTIQSTDLMLVIMDMHPDPKNNIEVLINKNLGANYLQIMYDLFHASYFVMTGIVLVIGRLIQSVGNEKNFLTTNLVFSSVISLIFWVVIFVLIVRIEPASSSYVPEINLPDFNSE